MNVKRLFVSLLLPLVLAACATGPKLSEMKSSIPTLSPEHG